MQDVVERALATVHRRPVTLTVAGRTDAGVHAWAQVASHEGEPAAAGRLNGLLPADVSVLACEQAPDGFDARGDATSRAYCYRVLNRRARSALQAGRALWRPRPLDRSLLHAYADELPGRHDFSAFTPADTHHTHFERRVLSAEWREEGDVLELWIEAQSFMRHMNRILVGTMLELADARRPAADLARLLEGAPRSEAGATAPAHGLYFAGAGYGGVPVLGADPS